MLLTDWQTNLGSILKYLLLNLLVSGCTATHSKQDTPVNDIPSIGQLDQLAPVEQKPRSHDYYLSQLYRSQYQSSIEKLRYTALREAALGFGSQLGYQERVKTLTRKLENHSNSLSVIFDFGRVATMLEPRNGYLLPPVVNRALNAVQTDSAGTTLASSDEYLTITQPGKLSTTLPSWREYLLIPISPINNPPRSLIPQGPEESKIFNLYFEKGWWHGSSLANDEFQLRIRKLQQTYLGMLNYLELVKLGTINQIVVLNADMGNLKDGNSLRINNTIVKIVSQSSFEANPSKWQLPENTQLNGNIAIQTNSLLD